MYEYDVPFSHSWHKNLQPASADCWFDEGVFLASDITLALWHNWNAARSRVQRFMGLIPVQGKLFFPVLFAHNVFPERFKRNSHAEVQKSLNFLGTKNVPLIYFASLETSVFYVL